jgi:hypothetical protein
MFLNFQYTSFIVPTNLFLICSGFSFAFEISFEFVNMSLSCRLHATNLLNRFANTLQDLKLQAFL